VATPRSSKLQLALIATLALCAIRLWLMPLPSSFWVDEMGTAFVVHHGKADPTLRVAPQVADSIYYALPALAEKIFGFNEISFRIFSVLAIAVSLFLIARIAARLIHPDAAWFVAFGCLALRNFDYEAADARPYAIGTLVLCLALWFLIRWMDSARWIDGLAFAASGALLWSVHLIFWPFYILFAVYVGYRFFTSATRLRWPAVAAVAVLIAAGVVPAALRSLALLHQAGAHVVVPKPRFQELENELKISLLTGITTLALLVGRYLRWEPQRGNLTAAAFVLIAGWWLLDPLAIYLFSIVSHESVFVPRYMFLAEPGIALMLALLVSLIVPAQYWRCTGLALGIGVLAFGGHWRYLWPPHHNSDWRAAAAALRAWNQAPNVPVICPSPFIEARPPVWRPDYPLNSFLYSNLAVYPMTGKIYPFPFESSSPVERYADELAESTLSRSPRFAIFGGDRAVDFWRDWLAREPELQKWHHRNLGLYGDVEVVVFEP